MGLQEQLEILPEVNGVVDIACSDSVYGLTKGPAGFIGEGQMLLECYTTVLQISDGFSIGSRVTKDRVRVQVDSSI